MQNTAMVYASTDSMELSFSPVRALCRDQNLRNLRYYSEATIDWSFSRFVSITQIVAITQLARDLAGCGIKIQIHTSSSSVANYVSRMNFFKILGIEKNEMFNRHSPQNRFIPMQKIEDGDVPAVIATNMNEMLKTCIAPPGNSVSGLVDISFSEIMDNVINHSKSTSNGLAAGQYYPAKGVVELCVADSGQGIAESMGTNPKYRGVSAQERFMNSIEEGYGQFIDMPAFRNEETSGGKGLTIAKRTTAALGGRMWIVSQNDALEVGSNGVEYFDGYYYPGTIVAMRLPVDNTSQVLESQIIDGGRDVPITWDTSEGYHPLTEDEGAYGILW